MSSLNHYYKTCHYFSKAGTHSFEGISLLCSPSGKAINRSFSTSPETLSPRTDLAEGYREGFPGDVSGIKNPPANTGDIRDAGSIPGLGRSPGGGHGNPLQYSCLENPMAWQGIVHGVTKSQTQPKWLSMHIYIEAEFLASYSNPGNMGTVQWMSRSWVQIPSLPLPVWPPSKYWTSMSLTFLSPVTGDSDHIQTLKNCSEE